MTENNMMENNMLLISNLVCQEIQNISDKILALMMDFYQKAYAYYFIEINV